MADWKQRHFPGAGRSPIPGYANRYSATARLQPYSGVERLGRVGGSAAIFWVLSQVCPVDAAISVEAGANRYVCYLECRYQSVLMAKSLSLLALVFPPLREIHAIRAIR